VDTVGDRGTPNTAARGCSRRHCGNPSFFRGLDASLDARVMTLMTCELLRLGPNKRIAQGTRLGYVVTGFPNNLIRKPTLFWK